jgi:hypothetical protein
MKNFDAQLTVSAMQINICNPRANLAKTELYQCRVVATDYNVYNNV